ncbi:MAG: V-type ATPase subunit [Firmicutes bacterium]|nr:V-type ATPase subunit [Bacillota bacterium]
MNDKALKTKLKIMKSNLFKRQDYILLSQAKNIEEITDRLKKNVSYNKFVSELDEKNLHRSDIERKLFLSLRSDFKKIYKFVFSFGVKKYLDVFFLKYEAYILKLVLCMIYDKRELKYNLSELDYIIGSKLKIDVNKLRNSENVEQFIFSLRGTEFFEFMNKCYKETKSLFELEMKLDLYYYLRLDKAIGKYLNGNDKSILKKINGIEVDLANISMIYRIKKYYKVANEKIWGYLIPSGYRLKKDDIMKFLVAKDLSDMENMICNSYYGRWFKKESFNNIEKVIYDCLSEIYYRIYLNFNDSIFGVIYYFYLKKLEINNITSLIEGVRYKLVPDKIMDYIFI